MDIKKFSNFQPDLLQTDPEIVNGGKATDLYELKAEKKMLDAPLAQHQPIPHPLRSDSSMRTTLADVIEMRRRLGGAAQAEQFIKELSSAAQLSRGPPGTSASSRLHFDMLLGRDEQIGYGDYLLYDNQI